MTGYLTPGQDAFALHLAKLTGLNPGVIRAWTLAEESGGAAQQRQAASNMNWLNVGYFDSGPGSLTRDQMWRTPEAAAQATADFLMGKRWGAAPGIRAILRTAGQSPEAQLRAIWTSPWASSKYGNGRDLQSTYKMVAGMPAPTSGLPVADPAVAAAAPATTPATPDVSAASSRRSAIQSLINSNAKLAHIPTINLPQIEAPVQVEAPAARRAVASGSPAAIQAVGSQAGNAIVQAAKQFLGLPYSWGGGSLTGPSTGIDRGANTKGFDCSGLTRYAIFKATGKVIDRVTYDQIKQGKAVAKNAMQPGDLIFFGTWSDPHHVGIYMGNGQFIQAPRTGDVIKISSLAGRSDFLTARRFV